MSKPPLWKVMDQAHLEEAGMIQYSNGAKPVLGEPDRFTRAAEIRALRDWLVPEESIEDAPGRFVNGCCLEERQRLRSLLTAEADRAERGDRDKTSTSADQ